MTSGDSSLALGMTWQLGGYGGISISHYGTPESFIISSEVYMPAQRK